jgi:hypothetical protein
LQVTLRSWEKFSENCVFCFIGIAFISMLKAFIFGRPLLFNFEDFDEELSMNIFF